MYSIIFPGHGIGSLVAGGAAAAAAAYGAHHVSHAGQYPPGAHMQHGGQFKHHGGGKFKHGKFGKHGKHKHGKFGGKFKKWK